MSGTRNANVPATAGDAAEVAERQRRARGEALTHRLMMMHELLVSGSAPEEVVAQAQLQWHISRRQALRYLYRIRKRLLESGYREDRAYVQQMGLVQRGRVLGKVMNCLRELDADEAPSIPLIGQLAGVAAKLIDARDRSAIAAEGSGRDTTPDRPCVANSSRPTRAILVAARARLTQLCQAETAAATGCTSSPKAEVVAVAANTRTSETAHKVSEMARKDG